MYRKHPPFPVLGEGRQGPREAVRDVDDGEGSDRSFRADQDPRTGRRTLLGLYTHHRPRQENFRDHFLHHFPSRHTPSDCIRHIAQEA